MNIILKAEVFQDDIVSLGREVSRREQQIWWQNGPILELAFTKDLLPQDQRRKGKQNFHLGLCLINKTHRNSASLNLFRMITGGSWCIPVHHWSWTSDEWWSLMSFPNWSLTVGSWFGGKDGYPLLSWEESTLFSHKHWHYPLTGPWWMRGLRDGCITE